MFIDIQGIPIYYEITGDGFPVVNLHGFYPDHRLMTGCMEPVFAAHPGWKRIYVDLPGMGRSGSAAWLQHAEQMLEIVVELLRRLLPGQHFALAGQSYGAYLSRAIIHHHPDLVDGVLMLCPLVIPQRQLRQRPPRVVLSRQPGLIESLPPAEAEAFQELAVIQTRATWARTQAEVLSGMQVANAEFLEAYRQSGYGFLYDIDALAQPFPRPALILAGCQDPRVGCRDAWKLTANYPHGTFVALDRSGHNLQIEQPEIFTLLAGEWLERVRQEMRP
ncbi:MAG: alpha/beta hydrolase [Chloroflexi bacterium]|nr:alpha/beta hydrolase [Chloroflexota bacterium]